MLEWYIDIESNFMNGVITMNKKLIAAVIAIIIAVVTLCLAVRTGNDRQETTAPSAEGQPITVNLDREPEELPLTTASYDKKITVTLPIEVVDKEYGDDLEAFAEAKGYFSIKKKGDDMVKIKMREYSYRLLLTSVGIETVSGIGYAMDSGDYTFVDRLAKYNSDFSDVVFTVDKEKYEKAENKDEFFTIVAVYCHYYQKFCEDNKGMCKITVCEKGTNLLIETREIREGDLD